MVASENRSGAYLRYVSTGSAGSPPFAGRPHLNIDTPGQAAFFFASLALIEATSARGVAANSVLV